MTAEVAIRIQDLILVEISRQGFCDTVCEIVKANYKYNACSGLPATQINSIQIVKLIDLEAFKIRKKVGECLGFESSYVGVRESVDSTTPLVFGDPRFKSNAQKITFIMRIIIKQAVLDVEKQGCRAEHAGEGQQCGPGRRRDTVLEAAVLSSLLSTCTCALLAASIKVFVGEIPACHIYHGAEAPNQDSFHNDREVSMSSTRVSSQDSEDSTTLQEQSAGDMSGGIRGEVPRRWRVVGGIKTSGLLVRQGKETQSKELCARLGTGAVVEEIELSDSRLHYERLSGEGPDFGWVSIATPTSRLLEPLDGVHDRDPMTQELDPHERLRHLRSGRKVE